jgi:hypothetical protein
MPSQSNMFNGLYKRTKLSTATFKCYLCPKSDRVSFSPAELTTHLTNIHQFPAKKFLQATVRVNGSLRRIILHEMNSCPIGGCNAGHQEFTQQRLISHVQKESHRPSAMFNQAIDDGYYFWWPIKFSTKMAGMSNLPMVY